MLHKSIFTKSLLMILSISFFISCTKEENDEFIEAAQEIEEATKYVYHYGDVTFSQEDGVFTAEQDKLIYTKNMVIDGYDAYLFDTQEKADKFRPYKGGGNGNLIIFAGTTANPRSCRFAAIQPGTDGQAKFSCNFPAGFNNQSTAYTLRGGSTNSQFSMRFHDLTNSRGTVINSIRIAVAAANLKRRDFKNNKVSSFRVCCF